MKGLNPIAAVALLVIVGLFLYLELQQAGVSAPTPAGRESRRHRASRD